MINVPLSRSESGPLQPEVKPNNMPTAKITIFEKAGVPLTLKEVEIPALKAGEVLVRTECTTLCRSDLATYVGRRIEKSPTILGHEIVGRIAAFGPGTPTRDARGETLHVGDRVTWAIYAASPDSELSHRGIPQKSPDLFKYGHERLTADSTLHGGLGEYVILRRHTPILPLSTDVAPPVAATINCAMATAAGALRLAGPIAGRRVTIWGVGMLGVVACAMARTAGAAEITAVDIAPHRLNTAARFGATRLVPAGSFDAIDEKTDIAIDFSGNLRAMEQGVERLAVGGTAVWVGGVFPQNKVHIDSERIIRNLSCIRGLHNYNADDFQYAVSFIKAYHTDFPFDTLVKGHFTLAEADAAFAFALKENPYRVAIYF